MSESFERKPHVDLNMPSRALKARKIEALLDLNEHSEGGRLLEVGTGSGGIAYYFARHAHAVWDVVAVDVVDNRQLNEGYEFRLIGGCELPFPSENFDVVISNHVVEHVGDKRAQLLHLKELRRVLRPDGRGYLAVPNRWMLVEPHYRLPFLSWLPSRLADAYVRRSGKGPVYDCRPLTVDTLEPMLREAGFEFVQQHGAALHMTYQLERPEALIYRRLLRHVPGALYAATRKQFPTLIYVLRAASEKRAPKITKAG